MEMLVVGAGKKGASSKKPSGGTVEGKEDDILAIAEKQNLLVEDLERRLEEKQPIFSEGAMKTEGFAEVIAMMRNLGMDIPN